MKKRIKIIGIILLSVLLLISLGCKDKEVKKVKKKARKYLRETYDKEFVIKEVRYIEANKSWELTCAPQDDKNIEFKLRTGGGIWGQNVNDGYANEILSERCTQYYKPILKDIFDVKIYLWSNMDTDLKVDYKNLPSFKEIITSGSDSTYVNIFIYIFENVVSPPERKREFLKNVMELLEYMRGQNLKWGQITIRIYEEEFYEDKDIEYILEETNFFHKGSRKLEYNAMEYESYRTYGLGINDDEFFEIETIEELEKELKKTSKEFLRE